MSQRPFPPHWSADPTLRSSLNIQRMARFPENRTSQFNPYGVRVQCENEAEFSSVVTGAFVLSIALWQLFVSWRGTKTVWGWDQKHVRNNEEAQVTEINVWEAPCFRAAQESKVFCFKRISCNCNSFIWDCSISISPHAPVWHWGHAHTFPQVW